MWHCPQNDSICNQVCVSGYDSHSDYQRTLILCMNILCNIWFTMVFSRSFMLLPVEMMGSTANRFELHGIDYNRMMEWCLYAFKSPINIDIVSTSCGLALKSDEICNQVWILGYKSHWNDQRTPICLWINCVTWSTLMSCWIFVLLSLEMTGSTASRFEFQGVSYHGMMERRIYVYRLSINIDILLPSCSIALKMIESATRYEFQGMYCMGMSNGRL